MQDLKTHTLNRFKLVLPFFVRYVDDIALAALIDKIDNILNMFNSYHSKLQFIIKHKTNHSLSFSDLSLIGTDDKLIID